MKKKTIIILSISILTVLIIFIGSSYALFSKTQSALNKNEYQTGVLQIEYSSDSTLTINPIPMTDANGEALTPYIFTITNTGTLDYQYDLKLLTDSTYVASHGCANNQTPAQYIKVKLDDSEPVLLSNLTSGTIISDETLAAGKSKTYNLRMWLDISSPNSIIGSHFHGKIVSEGEALYKEKSLTLNVANGNVLIANGSTTDTLSITVGSNETQNIDKSLPIILTGNTTSNAVKITADEVELTIKDLSITENSTYYGAIHNEGLNTTINIEGNNIIQGNTGIYNAPSSTITLQGNGTLNATGTSGAGIGGISTNSNTENGTGGNININSGTITAIGGLYEATIQKISFYIGASGIGSGGIYASSGSSFSRDNKVINITGGNVTSTGQTCAAGIGGGGSLYYEYDDKYSPVISGGTINVDNGATVNATAGACEWDIGVNSAGIEIQGVTEPENIGSGGSQNLF